MTKPVTAAFLWGKQHVDDIQENIEETQGLDAKPGSRAFLGNYSKSRCETFRALPGEVKKFWERKAQLWSSGEISETDKSL